MALAYDAEAVLGTLNVRAFYEQHCPGFKGSGTNVMVRCPFHEDRQASLSISTERPGLWKCHGCGKTGNVISFHQLRHGGTYEDAINELARFSSAQPRQVFSLENAAAVYDYTDAEGRIVYKVARYVPKAFRPWSPVGPGGSWVQGLRVVPRVLYRLPAVLEALHNGTTIYVTEGEKDADAINATEGVHTATTWAGGAEGWQKFQGNYLPVLQSAKRLVLIRDKDEAGQKTMAALYEALRGHVPDLRLCEAASGKDAADHLQAGHSLSDLVDVTPEPEAPPVFPTVTVSDLLSVPVPDADPILPGWCWQDIHLVAAPGGTSKSLYTFSIALAMCSGLPILGRWSASRLARVLVIQEEDPPEISTLRVQRLCAGMGLAGEHIEDRLLFLPFRAGFFFGNSEHLTKLRNTIDRHHPDVVFVDSVSQTADIPDQNKTSEVRAFFRERVEMLVREHGCGLSLVHHTNKSAYQKTPTMEKVGTITGNTSFVNCCDSVAMLQRVPGKKNHRRVSFVKVRRFMEPEDFEYEIQDKSGPEPLERRPVALMACEEEPLPEIRLSPTQLAEEHLQKNRGTWFTSGQLCDMFGVTRETLRNTANRRKWKVQSGGGRGSQTSYSLD